MAPSAVFLSPRRRDININPACSLRATYSNSITLETEFQISPPWIYIEYNSAVLILIQHDLSRSFSTFFSALWWDGIKYRPEMDRCDFLHGSSGRGMDRYHFSRVLNREWIILDWYRPALEEFTPCVVDRTYPLFNQRGRR